jgi:HK97 family phage major capsid protein
MAGNGLATRMSPEEAEKLYEKNRAGVLQKADEAKAIIRVAEAQKRDLTPDEAAQIDSLTLQAEGFKARMQDAQSHAKDRNDDETKAAFRKQMEEFGGSPNGSAQRGKARRDTWGKSVVEACGGVRFKALTPSGAVLVAVPQPDPVAMGRPVARLRSLIHTEPTDGVFAFMRQTVRQSNAAPVAPGAVKPTSVYTFERIQDRARVIAHLSEPIARQDLSDAPLLQEFISAEMAFGLEMELEDQVLNGTGIGENLTGLANTAGVQTVARIDALTDMGLIKTLRRAITMLESIGLEGTGFVMSPADWELVETSAAETSGDLLLTNAGAAVPIDRAARRLFGIPVVPTPSCPPGTAYLADFTGSTTLYIREEAVLSWSEHLWLPDGGGVGIGASLFSTNQVVFRSEMRAGFGVDRPTGVVKISLV